MCFLPSSSSFLLELVFGLVAFAGLSPCAGGGSCSFSLCVADGLSGFLVDELAVKRPDLVAAVDKVAELIDLPVGLCQIVLRRFECVGLRLQFLALSY